MKLGFVRQEALELAGRYFIALCIRKKQADGKRMVEKKTFIYTIFSSLSDKYLGKLRIYLGNCN